MKTRDLILYSVGGVMFTYCLCGFIWTVYIADWWKERTRKKAERDFDPTTIRQYKPIE
jgi:hypothetical protein